MTEVYRVVLKDEVLALATSDSAQRWVDSLLIQLEVDGFGSVVKFSSGSIQKTVTPEDNSCMSCYIHIMTGIHLTTFPLSLQLLKKSLRYLVGRLQLDQY